MFNANVIASVILVAVHVPVGITKLVLGQQRLAVRERWATRFAPTTVAAIALVELSSSAGLLLPAPIGSVSVPVGALALGVLQAGAAYTHFQLRELGRIPFNTLLMAAAAVVFVSAFRA